MSELEPTTAAPEPIGDSPWLWACLFSGMGLFALVMMNRRVDQRQDQIEEKEHNRKVARDVQASRAAGKTAAPSADELPVTTVGDAHWQRKISIRPLIVFFVGVTVFSAVGLIWQQCRARGSPRASDADEKEPPA